MPHLDTAAVTDALAADPVVRSRLASVYGLPATGSAAAFVATLLEAFDQAPQPDPLAADYSGKAVFRAAVNALGSNSRSWSTFLLRRDALEGLLLGWEPVAVHAAARDGRLTIEDLRPFFPGTTGRADATALLGWAERLSESSFFARLRPLLAAIEARHQELTDTALDADHRMPCLVAFMGSPPVRWPSATPPPAPYVQRQWKLPGMGPTLGSEFFRNLGWNGFKPDRHVMRLLDRWVPDLIERERRRATTLAATVGKRDRATVAFLTYSLAGLAITPPGTPHSIADNLIWALGAYVERKGRESERAYVR